MRSWNSVNSRFCFSFCFSFVGSHTWLSLNSAPGHSCLRDYFWWGSENHMGCNGSNPDYLHASKVPCLHLSGDLSYPTVFFIMTLIRKKIFVYNEQNCHIWKASFIIYYFYYFKVIRTCQEFIKQKCTILLPT